MIYRLSTKEDLPSIMTIIHQAQHALKNAGIDQWQNGYPNETTILSDIEKNVSYLLENNGEVIAIAALSFNDEPTYNQIFEGKWLNSGGYGVIHRVAVAQHHKGKNISNQLFTYLETLCKEHPVASIKIDTHPDNQPMQRLLTKLGFSYCGFIFLSDGAKRLAFEKLI